MGKIYLVGQTSDGHVVFETYDKKTPAAIARAEDVLIGGKFFDDPDEARTAFGVLRAERDVTRRQWSDLKEGTARHVSRGGRK